MQLQLYSDQAERLNEIHGKIEQALRQSLQDAIEAGRILADVKAELQHGQFTGWIESNLAFSMRTAQRYMKVFEHRGELGAADNLQSAYKLLNEPKNDSVSHLEDKPNWDNEDVNFGFHFLFLYQFVETEIKAGSYFLEPRHLEFIEFVRRKWILEKIEQKPVSDYEKNIIRRELFSTELLDTFNCSFSPEIIDLLNKTEHVLKNIESIDLDKLNAKLIERQALPFNSKKDIEISCGLMNQYVSEHIEHYNAIRDYFKTS